MEQSGQPPESMGEVLHRSLASRYLAIVQIEAARVTTEDGPPDLFHLLNASCKEPYLVRPDEIHAHQVRIGINGDDQQFIDAGTAASFYLIVPSDSKH